jgi:hypothetical protein
MALSTPVAFFVFNRPRLTQRVFTQIAHARPSLLFVIADGPRASHSSDGENCQAVRRIVDHVDWPCRVFKHYSETNLGLVERITSGLNWIFEQVEECIILEDDCLPSASFFPFCAQLLERYQYDKQIMHINGYSYQFGRVTTADSYYFSRITCPWGWATWRRAWQYYDVRVRRWAELRETDWLQEIMQHPLTVGFFQRHFDRAYRGESKSWDSQWTFACLSQSALTISPRNDLIMNLGHGPDATQTKWGGEEYNRPPAEMVFPLRHPANMTRNLPAEAAWIQHIAEHVAHADSRSAALKLYAWLPAPVRYGVRALVPQRLRRALVRRLRQLAK